MSIVSWLYISNQCRNLPRYYKEGARGGIFLLFVFVFSLCERKNRVPSGRTDKMGSTMLPCILSLPVLSLPALSLSKGRRVEGQAYRPLRTQPRRSSELRSPDQREQSKYAEGRSGIMRPNFRNG